MNWIQEEWSWNKVVFKDLLLQEHCIVYLFKLLYMYTPHVLQVTPRKRVTHKILEIIYINKWLRFVCKISDPNG